MKNYIAQNFGSVTTPAQLTQYGTDPGPAIGKLIQLFIWLIIIGGAIYAMFNLTLAGYAFMSAGDDAKKIEGAWAQIYQTLIGLMFTAGSFLLAAIFGKLVFGDALFILNPVIPVL